MPRGDQLSRQWPLIQLIDRPPGITVDDAARELAVTIRTIWRDLDALQKAGFPLYTERAADGNRGVWRVREEFKRALPLKLTLGELAALLMSRDLMSSFGVSMLGPEVASAFAKIQNVLSRCRVSPRSQPRAARAPRVRSPDEPESVTEYRLVAEPRFNLDVAAPAAPDPAVSVRA